MAAPAAAAVAVGGLAGVGAAHVARRLGVPVDRAAATAARRSVQATQAAARMSGRLLSKTADVMRGVLNDDAVHSDDDDSAELDRCEI